jgi:hypothetical protein
VLAFPAPVLLEYSIRERFMVKNRYSSRENAKLVLWFGRGLR